MWHTLGVVPAHPLFLAVSLIHSVHLHCIPVTLCCRVRWNCVEPGPEWCSDLSRQPGNQAVGGGVRVRAADKLQRKAPERLHAPVSCCYQFFSSFSPATESGERAKAAHHQHHNLKRTQSSLQTAPLHPAVTQNSLPTVHASSPRPLRTLSCARLDVALLSGDFLQRSVVAQFESRPPLELPAQGLVRTKQHAGGIMGENEHASDRQQCARWPQHKALPCAIDGFPAKWLFGASSGWLRMQCRDNAC